MTSTRFDEREAVFPDAFTAGSNRLRTGRDAPAALFLILEIDHLYRSLGIPPLFPGREPGRGLKALMAGRVSL
jgi:hypothetical protein